MKKASVLIAAVLCFLMMFAAALADGSAVRALSYGELAPIEASPNQKLSFRSGPGTKYTEIFTIAASSVEDFAILQQEKGGSVMWGMVEFDSRYGRYRVYTGMKRIDTDKARVPYGNKEGVVCRVGGSGAYAYYGPGRHYASVEDLVPAWTQITVYHEENGYVMADFVMPDAKDDQYDEDEKQITRAWIPVHALSGYDSAEDAHDGWYDWEYEQEEVG